MTLKICGSDLEIFNVPHVGISTVEVPDTKR